MAEHVGCAQRLLAATYVCRPTQLFFTAHDASRRSARSLSLSRMLLSLAASGFSTSGSNATAGGRADYPTDGTNSLAAGGGGPASRTNHAFRNDETRV